MSVFQQGRPVCIVDRAIFHTRPDTGQGGCSDSAELPAQRTWSVSLVQLSRVACGLPVGLCDSRPSAAMSIRQQLQRCARDTMRMGRYLRSRTLDRCREQLSMVCSRYTEDKHSPEALSGLPASRLGS